MSGLRSHKIQEASFWSAVSNLCSPNHASISPPLWIMDTARLWNDLFAFGSIKYEKCGSSWNPAVLTIHPIGPMVKSRSWSSSSSQWFFPHSWRDLLTVYLDALLDSAWMSLDTKRHQSRIELNAERLQTSACKQRGLWEIKRNPYLSLGEKEKNIVVTESCSEPSLFYLFLCRLFWKHMKHYYVYCCKSRKIQLKFNWKN